MTKHIKNRGFFLIIVIALSFTLGYFLLSGNLIAGKTSQACFAENVDLKSSAYGDPLLSSDIEVNETIIYRNFQPVNISVNTSKWQSPGVSEVYLEITFSNNTAYNMSMTSGAGNIYWYEYFPDGFAPLGEQIVRFYIMNSTIGVLNDDTTTDSFWIKRNCDVSLSRPEGYYLNETLNAQIMVVSESMTTYDWNSWSVSVVDDQLGELFTLPKNSTELLSFSINNSFTQYNSFYYLAVHLGKDNSTERAISYFQFKVLNKDPEIDSVILPEEVLRSDENNARIVVNASDTEQNPGYLNVSVTFEYDIFNKPSFVLNNNGSGIFETEFHIDYYFPAGNYLVNISVKDTHGGSSYIIHPFNLVVQNNPPEINEYFINGNPVSEGISIYYGEDIVFTFNVSDLEGDPQYVKVALQGPNKRWVNTTQDYSDDLRIVVRTADLVTGIWDIYVEVTDADGEVTTLVDGGSSAPHSITIIPDLLTAVLPWIALVVGLILGVLVGFGVGYYRIKSKRAVSVGKSVKTKKITTPKKVKEAPSDTSDEKIAGKDDKPKKPSEKSEKKEPEKRKTPQRKIKRKL